MKPFIKRTLFKNVFVPIVYGCEQKSAIAAAQAIAAKNRVHYVGMVFIPEDESLSKAAALTRDVRKQLRQVMSVDGMTKSAKVLASHKPWMEICAILQKEKPDLLILEWPCQIESLQTTLDEVLSHPPCDIAIVNQFLSEKFEKVLVPIRGGPYAELALRLALTLNDSRQTEVTSLHLSPLNPVKEHDAAFRGMDRVLKNLPEIKREEIVTDEPSKVIFDAAKQFDLVILGASAQPVQKVTAIGAVAMQLMEESRSGVMVVKTSRPLLASPASQEAGQAAISILVDKWFAENSFDADEFKDLDYLLKLKSEQNVSISLALPALDEEKTVGNVIRTIQSTLISRHPLIDEIVLIDSNSTDRTREIAKSLGVPVYIHQEILPEYEPRSGKGEALWKSLLCTHGDIVIWLDTDIVNIHPRFAYGLIGPLLLRPDICFVKGFYRRPLKVGNKMQAGSGGRVTELTARPLLNLFFPELSGVIQPLSGEYGGRRKALEQIPFFSGYGVEIGLLIDIFEKFGLHSIGQVNLQERIHHNQPLEALSKMSFAIIQAVFRKLETRYGKSFLEDVNKTMKLTRYERNRFFLEIEEIAERERPAMKTLDQYNSRILVTENPEVKNR